MLVQKIEMVCESSDEPARSIPEFLTELVNLSRCSSLVLFRNGAIECFQQHVGYYRISSLDHYWTHTFIKVLGPSSRWTVRQLSDVPEVNSETN